MSYPRYSVIIPVFNRPDELDELLHSLVHQSSHDFEVIIIEDGSSIPCGIIFEKYQKILPINYHFKENTGPGTTRNFGAKHAIGTYLIFFDSDCIIPPGYFNLLDKALVNNSIDFFGGPDRAHPSFSNVQKAINYSMTSPFTTGGIRGGKYNLDRFYPRSFNMGIKREVFEQIGGFESMRFGEDIDLSIRVIRSNFTCKLIDEIWVYHKRRTDFVKFFRQVFNSGIARYNLSKKYPNSVGFVNYLPSIFIFFCLAVLLLSVFYPIALLILAAFGLFILVDSTIRNNSLIVGILSIVATFFQQFGYGSGFLKAFWVRRILGKEEQFAFRKSFYN